MLTVINGKIKVDEEDNQKIQFVISKDDNEKLKEYKNIGEDGKVIEGHYASFCLELEDDDKEVTCVITSGKDGKFFIDSVKNESDRQPTNVIEEMKAELGFTGEKIELEEFKKLELLKHPKMVEYQNHLESLQNAVKTLEDTIKGLDLGENFKEKVKHLKEQVQPQEIKVGDNLQEAIAAKMNPFKALHSDIINRLEKEIQDKMSILADTSKAGLEGKMSALTNIKGLKFEDAQGIEDLEEKMEILFASGIVASELKHKVNEALIVQLEKEKQNLEAANKKAEEELRTKTQELQTQLDAANDSKGELEAKDQEIAQLKQQLNTEVESLKKDLKDKNDRVHQLEKENKELEAKNKTTKQSKQSNAARYTAGIGVGLAVGLVAFTALERTVKLEMLVMIGIAVASALVVGGITYAVLPGTQVDGAKAQEVNGKGKGGH